MVSENSTNKRLFSRIESSTDLKANITAYSAEERRDFVRNGIIPVKPEDCVLVSSKWYEQFMEGTDAPVVLACGAAGNKIDRAVYDKLSEWYSVEQDVRAVRVADVSSPNAPFKIINLNTTCSLKDALQLDEESSVVRLKQFSAFVNPANVNAKSPQVPLDASAADLDLNREESLVIVKQSPIEPIGRRGLTNMGNTCFMNSSLQALLHIPELLLYFASGDFNADLNPDNPIGCRGLVAKAFANLVKQTYSSSESASAVRPYDFMRTVGMFNRAFSSRMQQDSQEFTAFLLDSLHEDLNRVIDKPATEKPELPDSEPVTDQAVAALASRSWETHKRRNDSKIIDLFTGMYKSTLVCPVCSKVSITFDPFFDITLPLPSSTVWLKKVVVVPAANQVVGQVGGQISTCTVSLQPTSTILQMKEQVCGLLGLSNPHRLIVADVYSSQIYKIYEDTETVADSIDTSDEIILYENPTHPESSSSVAVPVYLRQDGKGQGMPFFISVESNESLNSILSQIQARLIYNAEGHVPAIEKVNCFDGRLGDLIITYGDTNQRQIWPPQERQREQEHEHQQQQQQQPELASQVDEPFVNIRPERPENEEAENLPTPASSPNSAPYSPTSAASQSSSSISPISSDSTPPNIISRSVNSPDDIQSRTHDPHNMVLLVTLSSNASLEGIPADLPVIENPAAVEAERSLLENREITLDDCLKQFSKPEVLGEQDLWWCPVCKDFRRAQKQLELWKTPDVLMVHLKRFSGMHNIARKINDLVKFPLEGLDVSVCTASAAASGQSSEEYIYDLIAVDNHYGGMGGGHYTSYVKDPLTGEWLDFNDSFVSPIEPSRVCTSAAYLLFYRKRSSQARSYESAKEVEQLIRSGQFDALQQPHSAAVHEVIPDSPRPTSEFPDEGGRVLGTSSDGNESPPALPWANL